MKLVYLIPTRGKQKGKLVPIKAGRFLLGSEDACQLRARLPGVGARHCVLVRKEGDVFLQDLSSGQPTVLNGQSIPSGETRPLRAGDLFTLGPLEFMVQTEEEPAPKQELEDFALDCLDSTPDAAATDTIATAADSAVLPPLQPGETAAPVHFSEIKGVTTVRFRLPYMTNDAEIEPVRKEMGDILKRKKLRVLLDFKDVRHMSSDGAEMIVGIYQMLKTQGSRMAVCRVRPELQAILRTLLLDYPVKLFQDTRVAYSAQW